MAGAYEISCPDSQCEKEAIFQLDEIEKIVGKELTEKHKTFRLNTGKYIRYPGCSFFLLTQF